MGSWRLFGFVLAQPEFPWGDLLEQVPVRLGVDVVNERIYGDIFAMNHLCMLNSPDGEPLVK